MFGMNMGKMGLVPTPANGSIPPPDPGSSDKLLLENNFLLLLENGIDAILLETA